MKTIFISHSSKDEFIVKKFIDDILIGALSIKLSDIFCTATDGTKIKSGEDWRNSIRTALSEVKITILIITPHYKESEICLNEMGAAWITSSKVIPLIVDPINYSTVGIIQQPKQIENLLDESSLDRLKDLIQEEFNIPNKEIRSDRWSTKKIEFLTKVKNHLISNKFKIPMSRDKFEELINKNKELQQTINSLVKDKIQLESMINDLNELKDKNEVKQIVKKYSGKNIFEEFCDLCSNVTTLLKYQPAIINGIIFKSFSEKQVAISSLAFKDEIDEAISRDLIDEDLEADWETTKTMREIYVALNEVNRFLHKNRDKSSFKDEYSDNYEAPASLHNLDFWKEVFDIKIRLS